MIWIGSVCVCVILYLYPATRGLKVATCSG